MAIERILACRRLRGCGESLTLLSLSVTLALGSPASARNIYDTTRIVPFSDTECVGAKGQPCTTLKSSRTWIEGDTSEVIELFCPPEQPYVMGWDARHHEQISLIVIAAGPGPNGLPQRVKVGARNNADVRGMALIAVGCSTKPFVGGPFMSSRSSVPSNHQDRRP
jgi:hypothetical protein